MATATPAGGGSNPCVLSSPTASIPSTCVVGIAASPVDQALGLPRTVTFLCGIPVGQLKAPPGPGCYGLQATLLDMSTGAGEPFNSASCANYAVPAGTTISCANVADPICPPGYVAPPTGGCSPCPAGFQFVAGQCRFYPPAGVCPPGSSPFVNPGGGLAYCYTGVFPTTVGPSNEMTLTFTPTSPHVFEVLLSGYIPLGPSNTCPPGTTLTSNASLGPHLQGTACAFTFQLTQRAEEIDKLVAAAVGTCSAPLGSNLYYLVVGQGCLASVQAFGTVIVKVGVNCAGGSEPPSGTSAVAAGYPPGSVYACLGDSLSVTNIPVEDVPLSLTVSNGIFNPECFPIYAAPSQPGTPTATPSVTPLATPRPSPTPIPSPTPPPALTPSPTVVPGTSAAAAYCSPPGQSSIQLVTGPNGTLNFIGAEVEYSAYANPSNPAPGSVADIVGHFTVDGVPYPGVTLFSHYDAGNGDTASCGPVTTDATGTGHCLLSTDSVPAGTTVNAMVDFLLNCNDYSTTVSFTVGGPASSGSPPSVATAPAPNGVCILRTGPGQLSLSVSYTSPIDTQPPVSVTNVPIGSFAYPTPTPVTTPPPAPAPNATPTLPNTPTPTTAPLPTPTSTPTPSPTSTPTSTSTPTPTPSPTPTLTPSPTPTATTAPPRVLSFTLDAARVSKQTDRGNHRALNVAQQGQTVNLSLYYTVQSLPRAVNRVTTYEIDAGSRAVFRAEYRGTQSAQQLGPQVRYIPYRIPPHLAPDVYTFRAVLQLAAVRKTAFWSFAVVRPARISPR